MKCSPNEMQPHHLDECCLPCGLKQLIEKVTHTGRLVDLGARLALEVT